MVRAGVRVPRDLSITGFDDAPIARLSSVDLSTVRQDPQLMGLAAVEAALRRVVDPEAKPQETVVATRLVLRGSTAGPASR
jgi:DNA-binding LacI/PurR family transcriptional regulator